MRKSDNTHSKLNLSLQGGQGTTAAKKIQETRQAGQTSAEQFASFTLVDTEKSKGNTQVTLDALFALAEKIPSSKTNFDDKSDSPASNTLSPMPHTGSTSA